jgi:hypothetical protein
MDSNDEFRVHASPFFPQCQYEELLSGIVPQNHGTPLSLSHEPEALLGAPPARYIMVSHKMSGVDDAC